MIRLITASPGSGKTCIVIEWLCAEVDKGFYKEFYTNIENLRIAGVKKLPADGDWRTLNPNKDPKEPPKLVIIDEAQYFDAFMKENRSATNRIGKDLSTHRHYGIDIWFITQSTKLLNDYVLENVGEHVHLHRPRKKKSVYVYWWSYVQKSLSKSAFKEADDVQVWRLNPAMFELYKSTSAVTDSKVRTSQKLVSGVITGISMLCFIVFMVYQGLDEFGSMKDGDKQQIQAQTTTEPHSVLTISSMDMPDGITPSQSPQDSQPQTENKRIYINELHTKYLGEYNAEVSQDIALIPTSAVAMNGKCRAYNKWGERLLIDDKTCNSFLNEFGTMPKIRQELPRRSPCGSVS